MSRPTDGHDGAPPHKRAAAEAVASASGARARFLRDLAQYASDDEDDVAAVARSRGDTAVRYGASSLLAQPQQHASPPPAPSGDSDGFFFGNASGGDHHEDGEEVSSVNGGAPSTPAIPSRVGLSLLHRMHAESSAAKATTATATAASPASFEVVRTYVPLSTGGFLSTAGAGEDLMQGRTVRVGDVLSLRKSTTTATATSPPQAAFSGTPRASPTSASPPPPPPSSSSSSSGALGSAEAAEATLRHFHHAVTVPDNEVDYGRRLSPEMVRLLFEVTRVDAAGRSVEGLFLDGRRMKLPFREVRPAGYDERRRYGQWKADPASRPVTRMHSATSSPTGASAPGIHPCAPPPPTSTGGLPGAQLGASSSSPPPSSSSPTAAAAAAVSTWWVIPRLLVRVATEAAGDWFGKKCVVTAVRRAENTIRLVEWREASTASATADAAETRELIGVEGLETVVPKKGERGMIVLSQRRGEMCTVRSRVRGADGDLTGVEVEVSRTKEVVTLQAEELCALAR